MKRNHHEWTTRTPDGRRVYQAWTERGKWIIESAVEDRGRASRRRSGDLGSGLAWERTEPITLSDLRLFRDVLWNKYQRRRLAYKLVELVDAEIEEREKEIGEGSCLEDRVESDGG